MNSYVYYLEPKNAKSNDAVSRALEEFACHTNIICSDGKRHDLWECGSSTFSKFMNSMKDMGLKFCGWRRRGGGQIEPWPPSPKRVA